MLAPQFQYDGVIFSIYMCVCIYNIYIYSDKPSSLSLCVLSSAQEGQAPAYREAHLLPSFAKVLSH